MKKIYLSILVLLMAVSFNSVFSQIITLGAGTTATGTTVASPVNNYYRSYRTQMVYTAAEIIAAGIPGAPNTMTGFGFYIAGTPTNALPNWTIKMKHTTAGDAAAHDGGAMTTVYSTASYQPAAGGFDLLTLQTPFNWNGVDNILVDVCWDVATAYSSSGSVRIYSLTSGFRFVRLDTSPQCGVNTSTTSANKPQCKMQWGPVHCSNGVLDGDETAIDCGGSCMACPTCPNTECTAPTALTSGVTVTACNYGATVGAYTPNDPPCDMSTTATVWFSFTTGPSDVQATINITNTCFTQPRFYITSACGSYFSSSCTNSSSLAGYNPLSPSTTYYIAVTDAGGLECNFDITVTTSPDNSACALSTSLVPSATGPYIAGQTVTWTFTVHSWTKASCNWIQGIVPTLGPCWDETSITTGSPVTITSTTGSTGNWSWWADGVVLYNVNGPLYAENEPVGAGWFFLNTGSHPSATDPNGTYGDMGDGTGMGGCLASTNEWSVTFDVTVKDTCDGGVDCMVSMKTFADGEIGVYSSPGCLNDLPTNVFETADTTSCEVILPIELLSFKGNFNGKFVELSWITASEINNDYFIIERSTDGKNFIPILKVKGAGNSNSFLSYKTLDRDPLDGTNYYRLKQLDYDGTIGKSYLIAVNVSDKKDMLLIQPNPVNDNTDIVFVSYAGEQVSIQIFDAAGKQVIAKEMNAKEGSNKINFNFSHLNRGIYYVSIVGNNDVIRKRFIKD